MSDVDYRPYPILVLDDEPDILESFLLTYGEDVTVHSAQGGSCPQVI